MEEGSLVENAPEQMNPADSHGAIDLTARPASADARETDAQEAGVRIDAPLIVAVTEENFQDAMATSQTVPVVIAMWSGRSLESKPALATLEELAREYAGRFQLATVDIDAAPQIAQAFQIQGVPSVVALIGGRPLPLFQGSAAKDQLRPILDQVLEASAQMGVSGRIAVSAEQTAAPTPPEHEAPLAAEEAGDLEAAISGWERVIELNPRDSAAKAHLSRVRLKARSVGADDSDPAVRADLLFEQGDHAGAFDLLLGLIENAGEQEAKDAARLRLLDLFRVAGNTPEVMRARTRLATLVLV